MRKLFWIGMTVFALLFSGALAGCEGSGGGDDGGSNGGSDTVDRDGSGGGEDGGMTPADGGGGGGDAATPDGGGGGGGDASDDGATDTGGGGGDCEYTTDCPDGQNCLLGACVERCPDNPCPEGWTCVEETGFCWQQCFTTEDCDTTGYRCEGSRCVAGCPWHQHFCAGDAQCDPLSGECTPSFCQIEIQPRTDRLYYGDAQPGSGSERGFTVGVMPFVPVPKMLDIQLADVSDEQVQITGVGRIEGENAVPVDLPVQVNGGEEYIVNVAVDPTSFGGAYGRVDLFSEDGMLCGHDRVFILSRGVPECVTAQPATVEAGVVAWGEIAKHRVRLRNDCDNDVTIVAWNFISAFSDWMVADDYVGTVILGGGGTLDFDVTFAPTTGDALPVIRNTKLLVIFDDPANRVLELTLNGQGVL